jgi:hypothetical protein
VEDVDRPLAAPELDEAVTDGRRGDAGGRARGICERRALRELGRERGRVGAAGAVRRGNVRSLHRQLEVLAPVEEVVDRGGAVTARDERRRRAELDEARR